MENYEPQKDYSAMELDQKDIERIKQNRKDEIEYRVNMGVKEDEDLLKKPVPTL